MGLRGVGGFIKYSMFLFNAVILVSDIALISVFELLLNAATHYYCNYVVVVPFDKIGLVGCVLHRRSNALNTLLTFNITPALGSGNIVNEYRV